VEFLYDVDREEFSFMEVNARIQVEHPVSEEVTGCNLIRMQIELACGLLPPLNQQSIQVRGHAIEARILAEDPQRNFMPTPGRITKWQEPSGEGVRVDSALRAGVSVPPYYDSMIAKLVVHAGTRAEAIDRLRLALDQFAIEGIPTNIPLLKVIVDHEDFRRNQITTRWLEDRLLPSFRCAEAIAHG
jgi:acetyl-CoA carboxylase biotin carboxylase subunit